jgi:hypothetical protein
MQVTTEGAEIMKNVYIMYENGVKLHHSKSLEKLINYTTKTKNAKIYYNGVLIWVQNTAAYYNGEQ